MRRTQAKVSAKKAKTEEKSNQVKRSREQLTEHLHVVQYAYKSVSPIDPSDVDENGDTFDTVWCPKCRHEMSAEEVQQKFRNDTVDISTGCPECGERFETSFLQDNCRFVWLCPPQTKDQFNIWIDGKQTKYDNINKMLRALKTERPEVYFNAYRYSEEKDKKAVVEFLEYE